MNRVPDNNKRLYLTTPVPEHNDYINAVRCNSFKRKNAFILTQVPLTNTRADMWRLVADHSVDGIVLLDSLEDDQVYWPGKPKEKITFGALSIEFLKETVDAYEGIVIRDFRFENKKRQRDNRNVRQWQFTAWKDTNKDFDNVSQLNILIDLVNRYLNQREEDRSVVIQCWDGTQKCGMYVAYSNSLEMLQSTRSFDVAFAVKQVRHVRPQAFEEFKDLLAVYTWLLDSNKEDSTYYNAGR